MVVDEPTLGIISDLYPSSAHKRVSMIIIVDAMVRPNKVYIHRIKRKFDSIKLAILGNYSAFFQSIEYTDRIFDRLIFTECFQQVLSRLAIVF
ncbi:hypothetical protein C463_12367 [Halorubrum californiense DSM 19288]|uniref:Uncharacterized protein n=1 Tax=Halorubrum californiense DSM 19288 TaxID=1227465 RepID=M0E0Z4_9EURY|nr:hypothetical protein C463_12367 [Halorubrum californiense DSM 19288]